MQEKTVENRKQVLSERQIEQIQDIAATIRYGSITLVFQDNQLIQIDHCEKMRIKSEK